MPGRSSPGHCGYGKATLTHVVMKITVETLVRADIDSVWKAWNDPADIVRWNAASDDWHTTRSLVDLREGGRFLSRMEARDGSAGFDFEGTYTHIAPRSLIEYRMDDGRDVRVEFLDSGEFVRVKTTFDAETENSPELQRAGWQAISDNFARYTAGKAGSGSEPSV